MASTKPHGNVDVRRVLVVDDNSDATTILARVLETRRHEVCTAASGEEALEVARRFRPHVALLDLTLPRMSGYEAARILRRELDGIYLIAVTGHVDGDTVKRCEDVGFDRHLSKPITDLDEVLRLVERQA